MKRNDFVKREDVLTVLKSQLEDLSKNGKNEQERGYFNECLIQINELQVKAESYDQLISDGIQILENNDAIVGLNHLKDLKALSLNRSVLYGKNK